MVLDILIAAMWGGVGGTRELIWSNPVRLSPTVE